MQFMKFLIQCYVVCIFGKIGICQAFNGECSTDDGTYSGKRNVTNTGKACYPWRSDNKCFKGIAEVNSTFSHNYCRNPVDPSDCHQDLPWCYTDQNNGNWEYCDLPKCGSEPPNNCSSPLGMGDGRISDDQIYASSFMDQSSVAKYARLNLTNANYWRASWSYPQYAYLSVNLRTAHFITKIHVQGTNGYFIKRFKILYSLDGYQWEYYTENKADPNSAREFEGNHGGYDISIAYIKYPFIASKIAVIPVSFSSYPTLRIELFGCASTLNIPLVTEVTAIDSNTYWYLDKSPYVINAPITIPPGVLLKIEAGVKVIFTQPTSSLIVSGCLELGGIKGLEVKFLTNNILSYMGLWKNPFNNDESFWNGILINPDSGCKLISLNHVVVVGAGITTGIKNIEFNNLRISNSKIGLKLTSINENNVIRDCLFRQNLNGIETPRVGSLTIESSQFIENEVGVSLTYLPLPNEIYTNFIFVENLFQHNNYGIYYGWNCMNNKMNFTILRSNFSNHREYAISATQYCEAESLYSVVSSVFSSSSIRISSYPREYSLQILNSTVRDLPGKTGISIESRCKNLVMSGCTFTNISGYSLRINVDIIDSTIRINSSKFENNTGDGCIYFSGQQTTSINIQTNTFLHNLVGKVINFELPSASNIVLSKNIFKNFQSKYEISNNIIRNSNYSILASDNYWGVDDTDNISSRIFDFYTDSSKSFVKILTYFKDERFNEIVNSSNYQSWLQKNGTVGGCVDVNTTLSSSSSLTVTKNVFIPKGSCLVIKGPIKLEFLEEKAIVVDGGCIRAEDSILTSRDVFWNGISFINSNGSSLSNVTIAKTKLALELVNSSIRINKSNISTVNLVRISGQSYNLLEISNTQIVCSDIYSVCIRAEDSLDMIMNVVNSSVTSTNDGFYLDNIKRLQFSLSGSTLNQKYQSLTFGVNIREGHVDISNCSSKGNIKTSNSVKFVIKENNFSSDSSCLRFESYYESFPKNVTILDNVFNCNDNSISHIMYYYSTNASLIIARNKFLRGEIQISNRYPSKLIITNNSFNAILSRDKSFLEVILTGKTDEKVLIANNVFENVLGLSSVIKLSCFSDGSNKYLSTVYLTNNSFKNNNVTSTILTDCVGLTSEKNILDNPNSLYEMKVLGSTSNDIPQLMYFTRNFWGENVNDPNVRVYDDTNDRTLMKVRVDPWYNDTTMTRMVFRSEGFIKPNGEIGGTLTQDVVLLNKGSAYLVTEDITIPTGLKMTIESGVQLNFVSGGMNIQGTLVAKGNETDYITFNSRDANKKWKGLNFQRPFSKLIRELDSGWWQILHNKVWKTVSFYGDSYKKQTADILCKQAGFKESVSQTIIQCNSLPPADKSKILPCTNTSIPGVRIECSKNNELSLQECYIYEPSYSEFANVTCLTDTRKSEYYIKLQTKSGKWISFNDKNNTLQLVNNLLNEEEGMFVKTSSCQSSQEVDCFSVMPLQRLGWYLRFYLNEIILDLAINNRNPSTFLADSSFIRINKASSEYSYIKMTSQSLYLIEYNNTLGISAFDPMNAIDDSMYSFKIINLNQQSTRKKRDIESINEDSQSSILQKVKITNADNGLFIKGVPPKLEDIEISNTSSHGIQFTGFFTGETPILIKRSSISNIGGNAINFEMIGASGEFKVLIEECKLENCNQDCITWNGGGSLNVSKSSFKNFKKSAVQANVGTSNISITTNSFSSSTSQSVITLNSGVCESCYFAEIVENKFINFTQFNGYFSLLSISGVRVKVIGNLFDNVSFYNLLNDYYGISLSFENNKIANSRFGLLLQHSIDHKFSIKNNVFVNNTGVNGQRLKTLSIDYSNDLKPNIINNSFFNPESEYEIDVRINWDTSSYRILDLSMNKWLYEDYSKIMSKINCFYNDASKLPVNIWPAITVQNNSDTLLTRPTSDSTYFFNSTGGEVTFSFTIPNATSRYIFQNSILIPANVTLTIEPGTIIEFASGRGIVAYGELEMSSVEGQFITLTKATKMDFYATKSDKMSMTNMLLDANEIKFNSSKLDLSNIIFNARTSVISHYTQLNNCSFYGSYNGITWANTHPGTKLNYSMIVIKNSIFQKCSTAVRISPVIDEVKIVNSTFLDNYQALYLDDKTRPNFTLSVINCSFINNNYAVQGTVLENGVVEISKCNFNKPKAEYGDATGIDLYMDSASTLNVNKNVFEENVQPAIKLDIRWNGVTDKKNLIIQDNQFINISKTSITMLNMYGTDVNIYRNNFIRNNADTKTNTEISAIDYGFNYDLVTYNWPLINVSFSQNNVHGIGGKHVVRIWNSMKRDELLKAKYYRFELMSNSFLNNSPSDSVIATAIAVNISYNTFSNPLTRYDLSALFPSQFSQNCTMNDWGTNIPKEIRNRIKDNKQDPSVGIVIYEPYLNMVNFSCEEVNSCSGHGSCVAPNECQCESEWDGTSCSNHSCLNVYNCLGRGDCIALDVCSCNSGWTGKDCSVASCDERNNCSGRGLCIKPNECVCFELFSGLNCSECKSGRWGLDCAPCPKCEHGTCNKASGKCDCISPHWSGGLCEQCAPKFFKQNSITASIKENTAGETTLVTLNITEGNCDPTGLVLTYSLEVLFPNAVNVSSVFKMRELPGTVDIILTAPLDREEYAEYLLEVTATDSASSPHTSTANVTVLVEDENDCIPTFLKNSSNILISGNTSFDAILYTFNVSDCHEIGQIKYSMESLSSYEMTFFHLEETSGILRLSESLKERNFSSVSLNIKAFDGKFTSQPFQLNISIFDKNTYPPVFEQKFQTFHLNESTPIGYEIAILTAIDKDSPAVYYHIEEGNDNGIFAIDIIKGVLTLVQSLDFEKKWLHKLIICAYDDSDKSNALNDTSEVNIVVSNVNEFQPEFVNVSGIFYIDVEEGKLISRLYQFVAKDEDNDSITFMIIKSEDSFYFTLDSSTGWLSVIKPLNKSFTSEIMLQIVAKDNGNPAFETHLNVTIVVLPCKRATVSFTVMSNTVSIPTIPNSSDTLNNYLGITGSLIVAAISISLSRLACWISFCM